MEPVCKPYSPIWLRNKADKLVSVCLILVSMAQGSLNSGKEESSPNSG